MTAAALRTVFFAPCAAMHRLKWLAIAKALSRRLR
jgi:hypothetical protein